MVWIVLGVILVLLPAVSMLTLLVGLHIWLRVNYLHNLDRIFLEMPLFIIPRGQPEEGAEDVTLTSTDGLKLRGCYLKATSSPRKGVILFGLEFGSNRWSAVPACADLRAAGFDIFTYEPRNQGESDVQAGFEPMQWITDREVADCRAAVEYLKKRPDADPRGIGLYGFSKGANAGLLVAANDPWIRCAVTDGAFGTYSVVVPYMRYWYSIYNSDYALHGLLNAWYYGRIALVSMKKNGRKRGVEYLHVENAIRKFHRPLLMIHGGSDTYIKADMARELYSYARPPKELWIVPDAKHNQAPVVAQDEYKRRVVGFFEKHLSDASTQRR
jgi:pimeloyl-ACP methyl ester carboxylesterase